MPSKRRSNAAGRGRQQGRAQGARQAPATLDPTANDIVGVALVALAAAMTVALLVATPAPVTQTVGQYLRLCFGRGSLLVPLAIMLFAITFFMDNYGPISGRIAVGLALIVLAVLSLMSLACPGAEETPGLVLQTDVLLLRGGYVGGGVAWALLSTVGFGVGVVILVFVLVVGVVICGFSISGFVAKLRRQAAAVGGDLQASAARRAQEREARRERRRRAREQRLAVRAEGYDEYQPYEPYQPAPEAEPAPVRRGEARTPEPATSFLGARKTTVLRRDGQAGQAREDVADGRGPEAGPSLAESVTHTLGSLPTRILRRGPARQEPLVQTMPAIEPASGQDLAGEDGVAVATGVPGAVADVDLAPWEEADDETPRVVPPAGQVTIPEFLRQQAEAAGGGSSRVRKGTAATGREEGEGDPRPATQGRPSSKRSRTSRTAGKAGASAAPATATAGVTIGEDGKPVFALPPMGLLSENPGGAVSGAGEAELSSTMRRLQATLSEFGLKSRVVEYVAGPLVTTFHIEMGEGERVNRITNLEDDIALSLAAESVRIFAPIPGTSRVGIEIPNKKGETVHLGDVLPYARGGALEFAVGRDAGGKAVIADLAKMPHLLVAGATGSGKSVMINTLIMSILMRDTPKDVRLILVDPKRVEFSGYNGLPHLYVPVVTEPRQAASALQWAVSEMERRLKVFERAGARNIGVYNEMCVSGKLSEMDNPPEPMPFLVIIIDELSDLMMVAGKDVEASIVRIAQLARAAGIHLVLATQRPSADVVTGLIKSNIETRIALSVASSMDSRVILDQTGAERLLGNGDMLFKFRGHRTRRVLGCFVSDEEISSVVTHWTSQGEPDYHEEILTTPMAAGASGGGGGASDLDDQDDPLVWEAAQIVVESRLGSTSGLQRRLKVGYARAGRIMDMLEAKGVVGPPDGSKPREVLLDEEGLEDLRAAEAKFREV